MPPKKDPDSAKETFEDNAEETIILIKSFEDSASGNKPSETVVNEIKSAYDKALDPTWF